MVDAETASPAYFQHVSQLVTWLIVIVGWYFVDRRHNSRETRKETKAEIDALVEIIEGAIDSATAYHTAAQHDSALSSTVKLGLAKVSKTINLLHERKVCIESRLMVDFRKACTLSNFDTKSFATQPHAGPLVKEINETGQDLVYALRRTFIKRYPC